MGTVSGIFIHDGMPLNGATAKLWRTEGFASPPAYNAAEPGAGYQEGSTIITGISYGGPGAFRWTGIDPGEYYVSVEHGGNRTFQHYTIYPEAAGIRSGLKLSYVDAGTIQVAAGSVVFSNGQSGLNGAATNVTFANLDTGAEAAGTDYYVYAVPDGSGGISFVISASASAPTGYSVYQLIGWFHNNPASNVSQYSVASGTDIESPTDGPRPGMVRYPGQQWMIDIYIASDSGGAGKAIFAGQNAAQSKYNQVPWASLTYFQQYKACMNAGRRLCTNEEWSMAAFGTPVGADNNNYCWTASGNAGPRNTGLMGAVGYCVSTLGCYDMTGNVWERVATWYALTDVYTDMAGWAWASGWTNEAEGGGAYTPYGANAGPDTYTGPRALLRGGDWHYSTYAGGWAVYGYDSPRYVETNIGFRCCA